MKIQFLTPRLKAIGKLEAIRQVVNDDFNGVNPYSKSMRDWQNYGLALVRIDRQISRLKGEN